MGEPLASLSDALGAEAIALREHHPDRTAAVRRSGELCARPVLSGDGRR